MKRKRVWLFQPLERFFLQDDVLSIPNLDNITSDSFWHKWGRTIYLHTWKRLVLRAEREYKKTKFYYRFSGRKACPSFHLSAFSDGKFELFHTISPVGVCMLSIAHISFSTNCISKHYLYWWPKLMKKTMDV